MAHSSSVETDIGFHAAGRAYLSLGHLPEAEENLILSDSLLPDPMTKVYLAEIFYRMGRFAEAFQTCQSGAALLESFEIRAAADFDGTIRNPSHYPYQQKKGLRKAFLAIEGKSLMALGETESGKERIQDSLDVNLPFESRDLIYADLREFCEGYLTRRELEKHVAHSQQVASEAMAKIIESRRVIGRLGDIISTIGQVQRDWVELLEQLKDNAAKEIVSDNFSAKIHAFCLKLTSRQVEKSRDLKAGLRASYSALPGRVVEQLSNAEFLLDTHQDASLPTFAGVIIEYCKALETALNSVIIAPFLTRLPTQQRKLESEITISTPDGKLRSIRLGWRGQPQAMLGDFVLLLGSDAPEWVEYCRVSFPTTLSWIRSDLPKMVKKLKDQYRNGCAHYSSADRATALEMKRYLEDSGVFARLNAISGSAAKGETGHSSRVANS
jgi:hypothetical protein